MMNHQSNFTEAIESDLSNIPSYASFIRRRRNKIITMDRAPSNAPSYASLIIRRRRNKRRVRHEIPSDTYMLNNYIRQLPPSQNTNDPLTNQFFNGFIFR
jgi:hypothetical protein